MEFVLASLIGLFMLQFSRTKLELWLAGFVFWGGIFGILWRVGVK